MCTRRPVRNTSLLYSSRFKFAGIAGPALFAASVSIFGSSRAAVLSVIVFFVCGALVLTRVNVAEGEAHAREATAA